MIACTTCKTISPAPERVVPGSDLTEILLWLFFLLPGIIYSIWRSNAAKNVCPACGSPHIVPLTSPMGQEIQRSNPESMQVPSKPAARVQDSPSVARYIGVGVLLLICILLLWNLIERARQP